MPATAAARAKAKAEARTQPPLTEREALDILNAMPCMVATCRAKLKPGQTVLVAYEVHSFGRAPYIFPEQPFTILRQITCKEYIAALPKSMRACICLNKWFYEIFTD